MMNNYGQRLALALQIAGKERQELADGINVTVQAIGQVIMGKTKALTAENSAFAAKFLGVNPFWLATGIGDPKIKQHSVEQWPFTTSLEIINAMNPEYREDIDKFIEFTVGKSEKAWQEENKKVG
jgi:antitoxin HigA-1